MAASPSRHTRAAVTLTAIKRLAYEDATPHELVGEIIQRVVTVVGAETFWLDASDPDTGICLGAAAYTYPLSLCRRYWEHEFLVPDFSKFADLTAANPVSDLREATGGTLSRSARYRTVNPIARLEDELRATLPAHGRSWGNLQLNRQAGDKPFTDADRHFLRVAAPLAGEALRRAMLNGPAYTESARGPGVIVLDQTSRVIDTTPEADAWVAELGGHSACTHLGVHPELLMLALTSSLTRALSLRIRLRTGGGTWLTAHASPLVSTGHVAVVIEPAKAADVAPLLIEAYGLTAREAEVTQLVAAGLGTEEIASTLLLSRHTVRDHLKAIFRKTGLSSRAELAAKLFTEQSQPPLGLPRFDRPV